MKKWLLMSFGIAALLGQIQNVHAESDFGAGVMLGEPVGLTVNAFVAPQRSIDAGIGWSFSENESVHLHADYLFHRFDRLTMKDIGERFPLYYGLGARVKFKSDEDNGKGDNSEDDLVGIRIPVGLSYFIDDQPIEFFAEIVPTIDVAPESDFNLSAALGVRYYF